MKDLIERQAAIDEIARWIGYLDDDMIGRIQLGMRCLPSTQPDVPDTNVGDMISRQAAIDALKNSPHYISKEDFIILYNLPSARPKLVTCEHCKHGVHTGRGDTYLCVVSPENTMEHKYDFWCAYAE